MTKNAKIFINKTEYSICFFLRLTFHTFKLGNVSFLHHSHFAEQKVLDSDLHTCEQLVNQKRILLPDAATNFRATRSEFIGWHCISYQTFT